MKRDDIDKIITVKELTAAEKYKFNLWPLLELVDMPDEKVRQLSAPDIVSGEEKYRASREVKLLPELHRGKYYDATVGVFYILSEIARDNFLAYLFKKVDHNSKITRLIFAVCENLCERKLFTPAMLWVIIGMCTPYDADKIVNAYDTNRARGRRRCIDFVQAQPGSTGAAR